MKTISNIRSLNRKHRGISPILATIILIVITVVVGAMLYGFVTGFFSSSATSMNANVEPSLVIPSGSSVATWSVTVKDAGTVGIKSMTVDLYSGNTLLSSISYSPSTPISPGQEVTLSEIGNAISPSGASLLTPNQALNSTYIVSGQSYSYQVILTFANGANKVISGSVTASSF